jgi:hypothetical protein
VNDLGPGEDALLGTETTTTSDGGASILESPWLWVAVGAAVLAGGTIAIAVAASSPSEPFVGNLGAGMVTFD